MNKSLCRAFAAMALATAPVAQAAFSDNLQLYYTFDSGTVSSTTVTDQYTADGSTDNVARTTLVSFNTGAKFGDALDVSTANGTPRATTSTASVINSTFMPGTGDYTLSLWYRQTAPTGFGNRIWSAGARQNDANNDDGLQLYITNANNFEVAYHDPVLGTTTRDSFQSAGLGGATFDGTAWNHLALVRSGTSLSLWVNGTSLVSGTLSAGYNIAVNTGTFNREANFGPDAAVTGAAYDDTAIWHRALSGAEVSQIYNGGSGATVASLIAIPEPSAYGLMGAGALAAAALVRRRRKAA